MTSASIFGIVISKLSYWKESSSVVFFEVNKSTKICLHCTILTLGLVISFGVKYDRKLVFDLKKITK